ncbi:hypothetical protein LTR37_000857 [Vermiconidia calcicola]|uniref:Uncharacterized protein n=1 Tax=Vermiconidia calcicola TaxID=1690605 RepID=A0ACC3NXM6_9PEZI|nr:hypothetical protein LTR37_000857 [Vermiconidia calcicola]
MTNDSLFSGALNRLRLPQLLGRQLSPKKKRPKSSDTALVGGEFVDVKMGKSNKFDYTNRSNSGPKLGQIIGCALQKEAEKVKKDGERHLQKARKQSTDSIDGDSDINSTTHIIDLKAPNKELGDHGVCALADGLEVALKSGTSIASLALEDLNISGNGITTASLARLALIVSQAKYNLKTVNLTNNNIRVETDEQAQQWQAFLRAFEGCLRLRRLDLSSNPLGPRAFEVFARAHVLERPIDPTHPAGEGSVLSLVSEHDDDDDDETFTNGQLTAKPTMADARLMKRRCGLRSLPYLTLHEVGLDDAGALWLSYIIQDHHYPNQLMDELNATNAESLIKSYQQDTNSRGIDWVENKTVGKEGLHLLEKTEALRRQDMLDDRATLTGSPVEEEDGTPGEEGRSMRRSTERRVSRAAQGDRRVSIRSIRTDDGGEHEATELETSRRRIQRHIIAHHGVHTVELWNAALKVFRASRLLLYIAPDSRQYHTGEPLFDMPSASPENGSVTVRPPTPADSPVTSSPPSLSVDTAKANKVKAKDRASYASKLVATPNGTAGEPELAITDGTNTPTTPLRLQKPTHRKGAFGEGTDLDTVTEKLNVCIVRDDSPDRFVRYQHARIAEAGRSFRSRSVACHLPIDIIEYLICFVVTQRERGVLSREQMIAAIERGQMKGTLMAEREWLRKDESAQVWMLLNSIHCLTYGE